jgi:hypothetical protein|tara:strand:- start:121 stop:369 length:249 start_codon:yes stop_codon:yes gene_type:complete
MKENDKIMTEMSTTIQEFIQEQLTKTDEPLMFASCLAAQVRHLYVAICGEETTLEVYCTMLEGLRNDVLKKGSIVDEKPTIH